MRLVAKETEDDMELQNTSADFNTLNYLEESINIYNTGGESEWEIYFSTSITDKNSSDSDFFSENILYYCSI